MSTTPATLTAIAYAAHQTRDRDLERAAIRRLRAEFGIVIRFAAPPKGGAK
jgi:hypothetical protein